MGSQGRGPDSQARLLSFVISLAEKEKKKRVLVVHHLETKGTVIPRFLTYSEIAFDPATKFGNH